MDIKNKLTVTRVEKGEREWGKEWEESSRNMYKRPMDKDKGGERIACEGLHGQDRRE